MIRKQFDIYKNYESVRVLMVYCVTAYHCAVCMNRDLMLIQMLHLASTFQRCEVPVVCMGVRLLSIASRRKRMSG